MLKTALFDYREARISNRLSLSDPCNDGAGAVAHSLSNSKLRSRHHFVA